MMTLLERAALFTPLDYAGVAFLGLGWLMIGFWIEHSSARFPSTSRLMADYRRDWMQQMIAREPRVFDAQIVGSLRQGTAFFASTSIIALGGVLAVMGNSDRLNTIADDFGQTQASDFVLEIKLIAVALFLLNAFLKFAWANRLFGYTSVLMGTVPNDPGDATCRHRAAQTAELSILAAQSFNRGLRAIYFALAAGVWLAGPGPLVVAVLAALLVIWRREFASRTRATLLDTGK